MKYFKKISFLLCCILPLFLAGCTPIVTITAPANGDTFAVGETITFEGTATDPLHPNLEDAAFVWTSDKDGKIGTGASIESSDLSEGEHTITLTVKDPDGQIGQSSVTITVGNGNVPTTTTTTGNTPTTTPTTTTTIGNTPTTTTTIAATGTRFKDNGNGTVTDTRTGLIWLKNAKPYPEGGTWADAETYCASLASGQKGLTDGSTAGQWRLPSKTEFEGIGTDPPATWESGFPSVTWTMPGAPFTDVFSGNYWSGTSFASNTDYAWYVFMGNGEVNYDLKGYSMGTVWPVRDDNVPITTTTTTTIAATGTRFTNNGNGTVTDTRTGLIWLKNAKSYPEGGTWADAETYCASLASGQKGLTDGSTAGQWRLPSKTEFEGIGTDPPATWESGFPSVTWTMPGAPFTDVFSGNYWSGTSFASNTDYAWYVFMGNGEVNYDLKGYSMGTVWPVRDDN